MIPKKIHYCWFGKGKKSDLIQKCILSWRKYLPDYEIIEWNEDNFDINQNEFIKKAYKEKKWAFVADFARLKVLYQHGGIYLDTDMEVLKKLDIFLDKEIFFGYEDKNTINGAIIGSEKENDFLEKCLDCYTDLHNYRLIPEIITSELKKIGLNSYGNQTINGIHLYETHYFYPIAFREKLDYKNITSNTYTIHHRDTSWYPWYLKIFKKLKLLKFIAFLGKVKNKLFKKTH